MSSNPNRKYGKLALGVRRDLRERGWAPARYWAMWWFGTGVALVAFYVLLTPIWIGLRVAAWFSDLKRRATTSRA